MKIPHRTSSVSFTVWFIIIIALGTIVSGILLLKQSAKKFNLSEQQLDKIKQRNKLLDEQEKQQD